MKEEEKDIVKVFLTELVGGMIVVVTMLLLALLFGGCAHKTFEEVERVHDTLRVYQYHRDSVIHRDSVFLHVYERGDTVYSITERWNVQYKDRVKVDTVYQVRDVAQQSKEVVEKEAPIPWWKMILIASVVAIPLTIPAGIMLYLSAKKA